MKSRSKLVYTFSALALLTASAPALQAQDEDAADAAVDAAEVYPSEDYPAPPQTNPFNDPKFQEIIDKIFGNVDDTPVDPARLVLADKTVAALMPAGAYSEAMNELFDRIARPIFNEIPAVTSSGIWAATGVEVEGEIAPEKAKAIAAIIDPTAEQRYDTVLAFGKKAMAKVAEIIEPPYRNGMARAYARKFTGDQLTEMNLFFASPAGTAFASNQMKLQMDPEVLYALFKAMPDMMEKFQTMGKDFEAEAKQLDKKPEFKVSQLSKAKQQELAKLLGVSVKELNAKAAEMEAVTPVDYDDAELGVAAAAEGDANAAAPAYPDEDGSEAWYQEDSWTETERAAIAELTAKYDAAAETYDSAVADWSKAEAAAVDAARKRLKKTN